MGSGGGPYRWRDRGSECVRARFGVHVVHGGGDDDDGDGRGSDGRGEGVVD